jgi:hypothetical protein
MRTTVLALTLIAAFAAPAFAEPEKAAEPKATHEETAKKAPAQNDDWETCSPGVQDDNGGCE